MESDNLGGPKTDKTALSATIERLTWLTALDKLKDKKASTQRKDVTKRLLEYPENLRKTLTEDNGPENTEHQKLADNANLAVYFCHAYHSLTPYDKMNELLGIT